MTHNCVPLSAGKVNVAVDDCVGSLHHAVSFAGLFPERSCERTHF